jgi:hypothetical protein
LKTFDDIVALSYQHHEKKMLGANQFFWKGHLGTFGHLSGFPDNQVSISVQKKQRTTGKMKGQ